MRSICCLLIVLSFILTGCGSDDGASSGGTSIITGTFSDSAVSNFEQTSGVAKMTVPEKTLEFVIPTAYAGGGAVRCVSGEAISFQMDALSNTVNIDTTCGTYSNIELAIRKRLLESMDGISLKRTMTDASYKDGAIDFTSGGASGGFHWNDGNSGTTDDLYVVKDMDDCNGSGGDLYAVYSFDRSTGKVTMYTLMNAGTIPTALGKSSAADCAAVTGGTDADGDGLEDSPSNASFRFKDGTLELDLSGSNIFEVTRGSVNGDGTTICNNATIPASNTCESFYEKFETCTIGVDCVL